MGRRHQVTRLETYNTRIGRERLQLFVRLYQANLVASTMYGLTSLALCSTYTLAQPHYTGHLFPAASAVVALLWGMHCGFLRIAIKDAPVRRAMMRPLLPVSIAVLAAIACTIRYWVQA